VLRRETLVKGEGVSPRGGRECWCCWREVEYWQGGGEECRQSQITVCLRLTDEVSRQLVGYAACNSTAHDYGHGIPRLTPSRKEAFTCRVSRKSIFPSPARSPTIACLRQMCLKQEGESHRGHRDVHVTIRTLLLIDMDIYHIITTNMYCSCPSSYSTINVHAAINNIPAPQLARAQE
jgi:hypothetical protein